MSGPGHRSQQDPLGGAGQHQKIAREPQVVQAGRRTGTGSEISGPTRAFVKDDASNRSSTQLQTKERLRRLEQPPGYPLHELRQRRHRIKCP